MPGFIAKLTTTHFSRQFADFKQSRTGHIVLLLTKLHNSCYDIRKMHSDLSPHLHSQECNALIAALKQCHADNPFKKFMGACNEADRAMTKCLRAEREKKRLANKEKGSPFVRKKNSGT